MDPVSLIVAALVAGAVAGTQSTATEAVKDAYAGLKGLARRRVADRPAAREALERPADHREPLHAELVAVDAGRDVALVEAARRVMALLDAAGTDAGRYQVDARGAQGVQIGDHGIQTNTFGGTPPA